MCAIDALDGVKKKGGNAAIANFASTQSFKAEDKMIAYEKIKKEFISQGMPPEKAIKAAEKAIKELAGNSANSGVKTNNNKDEAIGTSRQERERTEGPTNADGTAVTANNIRTGDQTNTDGNNDNMSGGNRSDSVELAKAAKESSSIDAKDPTISFNPALRRIAKRLEALGVTITPNIRKALEALEENDPRSLKTLSDKMQNMDRTDVQSEMKRLNGE